MSIVTIPNPEFTSGATGWSLTTTSPSTIAWSATGGEGTPGSVKFNGSGESNEGLVELTSALPCTPKKSITANVRGRMPVGSPGVSFQIALHWYDANGLFLLASRGSQISRSVAGANWNTSVVTAQAPDTAATVKLAAYLNSTNAASEIYIDSFSWNNELEGITLAYPLSGITYAEGSPIPFRLFDTAGLTITEVRYYAENTITSVEVLVGTATSSPWGVNTDSLSDGTYIARAEATLSGGAILQSNQVTFTVSDTPPGPTNTREYKASNSYTYFVAKNFAGIASAIPSTARVVGMETTIDYKVQALLRTKDIGIDNPALARYEAAFSMVPTVSFETVLLNSSGGVYNKIGSSMAAEAAINVSDFTLQEDGTSEGKRWTVLESDSKQVVVGGESVIFGQAFIAATEFLPTSLGVRFFPNVSTKPDYTSSGDACWRVKIDKLRASIYFDAGSVEYYFVSPDGNQIIKGKLAAAYVDVGSFASADAEGILQLDAELEIITGSSRAILAGWTVHSAMPPSTNNKIGVIDSDMSYNGLPSYGLIANNRTRYQFISANFYGDLSYDSIYGVNGVDRAFAYNGDFFYKIHTQPDSTKDKPRHVEFYHTHLALGYKEGRVDISAIGEPYNFSGTDGASSWAIGDSVTGLLNLSGTMLGVFCRKSIHGIAGTTVDNFATQVLSPKIGAIEYTITDMGFPVYANAYGIYTLGQTDQYGDYLGTPMSYGVSPWLRPRLIRSSASDKEVVVAWPVRSKNQYKLAFADGYVLTMTVNNGSQAAPTFSKQKYFLEDEELDVDVYEQPAIVPSALSSELDDTGQERIHIAGKAVSSAAPISVTGPTITGLAPEGYVGTPYSYTYTVVAADAPVSTTIIISGSLVPGLNWNPTTATISGTPSEPGTMTLVIRTIDQNGLSSQVQNTIMIQSIPEEIVEGFRNTEWSLPCINSGSPYCSTLAGDSDSFTLTGDGSTTYTVKLAIYGSVETKPYKDGQVLSYPYFYKGGTPDTSYKGTYNIYKLEISNPAQVYYLNYSLSSNLLERIDISGQLLTVQIASDATVTLDAVSVDDSEVAPSQWMRAEVIP